MNTFRIMSCVLIVTVMMFISKTTMAMNFTSAADLFSKGNANKILNGSLAFGGAYKLEELLEKKVSPKKARAIASTALAARHGKAAAAGAGVASFIYSGVEEYTPERIKQLLIDILPEKCTSEEAKTVINIKLSEITGVIISGYVPEKFNFGSSQEGSSNDDHSK